MVRTRQFRTLPLFSSLARVDRDSLVIRDVVAMQAGEAAGHGVIADMKTLEIMRDLGNQKKRVRGRFGHPGISENATGKQVQNASNFRILGDKLLHDSQLLDTARKSPVFSQDPIEYIMDMAENNPTELGESVVISEFDVWVMEDGREIAVDDYSEKPDGSIYELPVIRPVDFYFVDFVNEGALTEGGLFSAFSGDESRFSQQAFLLVDKWRERYNIPLSELQSKLNAILERYISLRGGNKQKDEVSNMGLFNKKDTGEETPEKSNEDGYNELSEKLAEMSRKLDEFMTKFTSIVEASAENSEKQDEAISGVQDSLQELGEKLNAGNADIKELATRVEKNEERVEELGANVPSGLAALMNGFRATENGKKVSDEELKSLQEKQQLQSELDKQNDWFSS